MRAVRGVSDPVSERYLVRHRELMALVREADRRESVPAAD
jgi:hypothetical protein